MRLNTADYCILAGLFCIGITVWLLLPIAVPAYAGVCLLAIGVILGVADDRRARNSSV